MTNRCNLRCTGCYARAHGLTSVDGMEKGDWVRVFREAETLGVSIVLLAGGEPFLRADLLDITAEFPRLVFPVFTNGLALAEPVIGRLREQPQVIPVISLEGDAKQTDARRGPGVFGWLEGVMERLRRGRVFFGISVTVHRQNADLVTDPVFIRRLFGTGCRLFFYVEYTPVEENTEHLVLTEVQRYTVRKVADTLRREFRGIFIVFPGDEEPYGGCLAAGRGFIHIGANGNVEPCPFAPYSDTGVKTGSLEAALQSDLLEKIRLNHDRLTETRGGCALWNQREWVKALARGGG